MDFSDQWEALIIAANQPATCTDKDSVDRRQVTLGRREFDELCAAAWRKGVEEAAQWHNRKANEIRYSQHDPRWRRKVWCRAALANDIRALADQEPQP